MHAVRDPLPWKIKITWCLRELVKIVRTRPKTSSLLSQRVPWRDWADAEQCCAGVWNHEGLQLVLISVSWYVAPSLVPVTFRHVINLACLGVTCWRVY